MPENTKPKFEEAIVVTPEIENRIKLEYPEPLPRFDSPYQSPLQSLMGNKESEDTTPDGTPEYNPKLIEGVVSKIVKMSSTFKVDVFNLDIPDAREKYAGLHNKQNIKILAEEGSFCVCENFSKDEKTKDSYYKLIIKYREIDYDKLIGGFEKACKAAILSHEIAIGAMFKLFPELENRSDEIIEKLTKAGKEGLEKIKEEREKRKAELAEKAKESKKRIKERMEKEQGIKMEPEKKEEKNDGK